MDWLDLGLLSLGLPLPPMVPLWSFPAVLSLALACLLQPMRHLLPEVQLRPLTMALVPICHTHLYPGSRLLFQLLGVDRAGAWVSPFSRCWPLEGATGTELVGGMDE